jgi:organic radical activating enzyme
VANKLVGLWWVRKRAKKEDVSTVWEIGDIGTVKDLSSNRFGRIEYCDTRAIIRWNGSPCYEILPYPVQDVMTADSWNARNCTTLKRFGNGMNRFIWRDRLESDISDRCNYSCKNCNHLSPYYRENRYSFDEWKRDIELAEQSIRTEIFNLLGGEPFLLNNLADYVKVLKASPICNRIGVYTNGALLPRLKDFSVLVDVDEVVISYYPSVDTKPLEAWLATFHEQFPCRFILNRFESFFVFFNENRHDREKMLETWTSCTDKRNCHTIYKGRYYLCPTSNKFKYLLREKYSVTEDLEDGFPLENIRNLQQYIDTHVERAPLKSCYYCNFHSGAIDPHCQGNYEKIL